MSSTSSVPAQVQLPIYDTPILGMKTRPRVEVATEYGNRASWWVEYPDGVVDLSRSVHLSEVGQGKVDKAGEKKKGQLDIPVDGERTIRIDASKSALVVVDMQK